MLIAASLVISGASRDTKLTKSAFWSITWGIWASSGEQANLTGLVLGGGGGGRPDYLQKLKVPEGYEKMIDYSNI